ncbi:SDR family NAD(P)-dependent oxidoreductase [Nocardia jiangxiensis]|uniref:SDR family NAD(P)-dependent oxidoreductase n=1 Tax=Nocardia jiangxiensis TaxID=282685 RepID=A0ABW6S6X3_9NOCA|nr:SDR family NAD(P)-dependent oxidoreductase [Nocardia jiangxiensis]
MVAQKTTGPDLTGRTVVVTGASSGVGAAAAAKLAARGATVAVVGRSPQRTVAVAERIGAEPFVADFARLDDVRELARRLIDRYPVIDVLADNAGGAWARRTITVDGNEQTFQVNHLAPFLLTGLLFDRLVHSRARVVNTASTIYRLARLDPDTVNAPTGYYSQLLVYATSKLANVIFTRELARRAEGTGLTTAAFHPGVVATHVYDDAPLGVGAVIRLPLLRPLIIRPEQGADPLVHLATTADAVNGKYFHRFRLEEPRNALARDAELAQRLWDMSEKLVGLTLPPT